MKVKYLLLLLICLLANSARLYSQSIPYHDHVVIVILENKNYGDIIGDKDAPYLNSLLSDPNCALLEKYYALTHPSQANYLMLFSGSDQNIILDFDPFSYLLPYTSSNLGASLIDSGYTFIGYSEDLPSVGYTSGDQGAWVRRHCPWVNWQGSSKNGIPAVSNLPFTFFPSNFDSLPTLSFVVPNLDNDMHDGSVATGDAWVQTHMDTYAQWAKTHNSLLIITFDETESYVSNNKVPALFIGQNVVGGAYSSKKYDHYDMLRTLEEMYKLPYAGESANGKSIYEIWKSTVITSLDNFASNHLSIQVYPNPVRDHAMVTVRGVEVEDISSYSLKLYDMQGKEVNTNARIKSQDKIELQIELDCSQLSTGTYFYELVKATKLIAKDKLLVQ